MEAKLLSGCCLGVLGFWILSVYEPERPEPLSGHDCVPLARIAGPEDIVLDSHFDRLLVSSQDRRSPESGGAIVRVELDRSFQRTMPLLGRDQCSFHPHGIDRVERLGENQDLLYVVNHHDDGDFTKKRACTASGSTSIEVFEIEETALRFVERLAAPQLFEHGNDLVATVGGSIYLTVPPKTFGEWAGEILRAGPKRPSKIVRYQCPDDVEGTECGGRWAEILVDVDVGRFVNGIALGAPHEGTPTLLISSSVDGRIHVARRHDDGWSIEADDHTTIGFGLDNIHWLDHERSVALVAAGPDLRRWAQHAKDPRAHSPSQVWQLTVEPMNAKSAFYDDGSTISGASSAMCANGDLILGQAFGPEVLRCAAPSICPLTVAAGNRDGGRP